MHLIANVMKRDFIQQIIITYRLERWNSLQTYSCKTNLKSIFKKKLKDAFSDGKCVMINGNTFYILNTLIACSLYFVSAHIILVRRSVNGVFVLNLFTSEQTILFKWIRSYNIKNCKFADDKNRQTSFPKILVIIVIKKWSQVNESRSALYSENVDIFPIRDSFQISLIV